MAAPAGHDGHGTNRESVAGDAVQVPAWQIHSCPAAGLADSLRPADGSQMAVLGQNDDGRSARGGAATGPRATPPVVTLVEHWASRLGPNPVRTALAGPTRA